MNVSRRCHIHTPEIKYFFYVYFLFKDYIVDLSRLKASKQAPICKVQRLPHIFLTIRSFPINLFLESLLCKSEKMASSVLVSALLSGVFQVLFDRLASRQVIEFFQFWSFDEKLLDELKIVGLTVDAVLRDAEEQQITNLAVKEWANRLEDAAYHAEDLLDEIDTLASQHRFGN